VQVEAGANQMAQSTTANRIIITLGKVGVIDTFDGNRFAHDPREDFLNWVMVQTGSFDAAANAWGSTWGAAADWRQGRWAWRAGIYNLAKVAGGNTQGTDFSNHEIVLEAERRHEWRGRSGGIRVTANRNREALGSYRAALEAGGVPDVSKTRQRKSQWSFILGADQDVSDSLSVFLRAGTSDGRIETYDFADVQRSVMVGASIQGKAWHRARDTVGLAGAVNGISGDFQRYLAAGGMGAMIGDGRLPHPGDEHVFEAYYAYRPHRGATITVDYQHIANPAYNRDRGPVNVFALRLHYAA
jgi:high affinity Mn2+ porin